MPDSPQHGFPQRWVIYNFNQSRAKWLTIGGRVISQFFGWTNHDFMKRKQRLSLTWRRLGNMVLVIIIKVNFCFGFLQELLNEWFEKVYQTPEMVFCPISKHPEVG